MSQTSNLVSLSSYRPPSRSATSVNLQQQQQPSRRDAESTSTIQNVGEITSLIDKDGQNGNATITTSVTTTSMIWETTWTYQFICTDDDKRLQSNDRRVIETYLIWAFFRHEWTKSFQWYFSAKLYSRALLKSVNEIEKIILWIFRIKGLNDFQRNEFLSILNKKFRLGSHVWRYFILVGNFHSYHVSIKCHRRGNSKEKA